MSISSRTIRGLQGACLDYSADDTPRHRAYVGTAVAAYLGLVMHAAERDAHELTVRRRGDALGDTGLARARRADKADKPALDIGAELLYGEVLEHTLLDLVKAEVIVVKLFCAPWQYLPFPSWSCPKVSQGRRQDSSSGPRPPGGTEGLLLQTAKPSLRSFFAYLVTHRERLNFYAVLLDIVILAELGLMAFISSRR